MPRLFIIDLCTRLLNPWFNLRFAPIGFFVLALFFSNKIKFPLLSKYLFQSEPLTFPSPTYTLYQPFAFYNIVNNFKRTSIVISYFHKKSSVFITFAKPSASDAIYTACTVSASIFLLSYFNVIVVQASSITVTSYP